MMMMMMNMGHVYAKCKSPENPILVIKVLRFNLFIYKNGMLWYSSEAIRWSASDKYPQYMFSEQHSDICSFIRSSFFGC